MEVTMLWMLLALLQPARAADDTSLETVGRDVLLASPTRLAVKGKAGECEPPPDMAEQIRAYLAAPSEDKAVLGADSCRLVVAATGPNHVGALFGEKLIAETLFTAHDLAQLADAVDGDGGTTCVTSAAAGDLPIRLDVWWWNRDALVREERTAAKVGMRVPDFGSLPPGGRFVVQIHRPTLASADPSHFEFVVTDGDAQMQRTTGTKDVAEVPGPNKAWWAVEVVDVHAEAPTPSLHVIDNVRTVRETFSVTSEGCLVHTGTVK